ncbi:hypothetical protein ABB37_02018 [Leptomonas pyrrhocoris]|uniref:GAF domain-containing protein n=1 Tax=Leptomonas pyrrhocoris TaxID=157538 RepID=A0A0N0DYB5_LEPPY|nr:hypothetical protein ABB37_02018 [Leptomonas pyrrhocoris]XP_015662242.1 hypothetical protein ABB37_02018 [Leptomonas pyrrhocoris]KPA83802.1 hypothetical protein ABB37_02018 [Leptomonas pyrrhocoris]KPA83803.1 hypothetical protein ABB37_02018 [Leptomonas pyrrhocoris]|eukprot:XP_015662241.1 hypothetical protein ABB37_02018 [Leptomonas pyrrhocoris]
MTVEVSPAPVFQTKKEMYDWLEKQTTYLVEDMSKRFTPQANLVIGLSNVAALCFYELNRFCNPGAALEELKVNWFGFYLFQAPGLLALGPFQGRPACTEIRVGRGVCGTVAESGESLVVPDVHEFPGHIACDAASAAEVVVPVLIENGSIVGVIDVDSTELSFFTEEDKEGLERVAAVLVRHLEFPMARALALNPSLGLPGYSALAGGERALQQPSDAQEEQRTAEAASPASPPTTTVIRIPYFKVEAPVPDVATKFVGGWQFTTTKLDRIMAQEEEKQMQQLLQISSLPEIAFRNNTLAIGPESDRAHPWLLFDVEGLMRSASSYYHTAEFKNVVGPQLSIPVSEGWQTSEYAKHDPNIDWAWRNNFFGLKEDQVRLVPRPADTPGINWDLLKNNIPPDSLLRQLRPDRGRPARPRDAAQHGKVPRDGQRLLRALPSFHPHRQLRGVDARGARVSRVQSDEFDNGSAARGASGAAAPRPHRGADRGGLEVDVAGCHFCPSRCSAHA